MITGDRKGNYEKPENNKGPGNTEESFTPTFDKGGQVQSLQVPPKLGALELKTRQGGLRPSG